MVLSLKQLYHTQLDTPVKKSDINLSYEDGYFDIAGDDIANP